MVTTTKLNKVLGTLKLNTSTKKKMLQSYPPLGTTSMVLIPKVGWQLLTMHCKTTLAYPLTTVSTGKLKTVLTKTTSTVQILTTNSNLIVTNIKGTPSGVSFFVPLINGIIDKYSNYIRRSADESFFFTYSNGGHRL